ncbi:cytochrome c maturation protein CcmE [Anaerolineae bacterium AMX1]|nr:cytochrome c maturation protein CcmE [Anaerolineae bacterium AMX1]
MGRSKFILGGLSILAAVVYLIFSSTQQSAEYFMTVDELKAKGGSVTDKSIEALGGLAAVLKAAAADPTRTRITAVYVGPKPDLLRDEAQAIMTGHLGQDGIFYADELLLKCPTKYEEAVPQQASGGN